jgi:hypothetical protein
MTSIDLGISLVTHLRASASGASATRLPGGAVVCDACGCRLTDADGLAYRHYSGAPGRDARGCRVACVDQEHRVSG